MMIEVWNRKHSFEIISLLCFNTVKSEMSADIIYESSTDAAALRAHYSISLHGNWKIFVHYIHKSPVIR